MPKLTQDEVIRRFKEHHGNKYDYSLVKYENAHGKVDIICPEHGVFQQTPNSHYKQSCPKCTGIFKKTTKEFIREAKEIHGDKWDYSRVNYVNNRIKITLICDKHGEFNQTPKNHLKGHGCNKCGEEITADKQRKSTEEFIKQAKNTHGDKYDYSRTEYVSNKHDVIVICEEHGEFVNNAWSHLCGHGCAKCANNGRYSVEELKDRFNELHNKKYDYSLFNDYKNHHDKITIICSKHGEFKQSINQHIRPSSCPKCKISKGEEAVERFLIKNGINYKEQHYFEDCKYENYLIFDFYLPDHNTCIEFDGEQHFKPVKLFGGKKALEKTKIRDEIKNRYCRDNNIGLIRIPYWELNKVNERLSANFF